MFSETSSLEFSLKPFHAFNIYDIKFGRYNSIYGGGIDLEKRQPSVPTRLSVDCATGTALMTAATTICQAPAPFSFELERDSTLGLAVRSRWGVPLPAELGLPEFDREGLLALEVLTRLSRVPVPWVVDMLAPHDLLDFGNDGRVHIREVTLTP